MKHLYFYELDDKQKASEAMKYLGEQEGKEKKEDKRERTAFIIWSKKDEIEAVKYLVEDGRERERERERENEWGKRAPEKTHNEDIPSLLEQRGMLKRSAESLMDAVKNNLLENMKLPLEDEEDENEEDKEGERALQI